MKFPWVSRELYNRVVGDLRKSEEERKALLDRMFGVVPEIVLPAPNSPEVVEAIDPSTGALNAAKLRQMAQDAANKRAGKI